MRFRSQKLLAEWTGNLEFNSNNIKSHQMLQSRIWTKMHQQDEVTAVIKTQRTSIHEKAVKRPSWPFYRQSFLSTKLNEFSPYKLKPLKAGWGCCYQFNN